MDEEGRRLLPAVCIAVQRPAEACGAFQFLRLFSVDISAYSGSLQLTNKWTTLGCALISTLLATSEGIAYLAEDRLVRQIAEALFQLDPVSSPPHSQSRNLPEAD